MRILISIFAHFLAMKFPPEEEAGNAFSHPHVGVGPGSSFHYTTFSAPAINGLTLPWVTLSVVY
jgi:hypothetical protein